MSRIRLCTFLFLALLTLGQSFAHAADEAKPHAAIAPMPRDMDWWVKRNDAMNARIKQGKVDLLFIGDSITQGWEGAGKEVWEKFYAPRNAVNLGIGGDQTQHVLWRLDHGNLDGIKPKVAVVMIGTNNSGSNMPAAQTAEGVAAIVNKLRERLPETKILLLAVFPRTDIEAARQLNLSLNPIIAKLADDKQVFFLDIGQKFLEADGTLSKEVMPDLLHLSPKGYTIWAESIEPTLKPLLGEK